MPYKIQHNKDGTCSVKNEVSGKVHANHVPCKNAEKQIKLLQAIEHNSDFKPRKRKR